MKINQLMGRIVLVDRMFKRTSNYDSPIGSMVTKSWTDVAAESRPGWVVGERWLQEGTVSYGYGDEGPFWDRNAGHSIHCLLVTYWPTMKPVRVPLDGYRMAPETCAPYLSESAWLTEYKERIRKEMQDWPRDARGRWVRKGGEQQ